MSTNVAPFLARLLTAQSADETTSQPIDVREHTYLTIWLTGTGTTSSGVITIEAAAWNPQTQQLYVGTWSPITTLNASDVSGGMQGFFQLTAASWVYIRARISTAIGGGGTITVDLSGH